MSKKLLIDTSNGRDIRTAVIDKNGSLEHFEVMVAGDQLSRGDIYLVKIIRVEPALQAAFVNFGSTKNGFVPLTDIHTDYYNIPVSDHNYLKQLQDKRFELLAKMSSLESDLVAIQLDEDSLVMSHKINPSMGQTQDVESPMNHANSLASIVENESDTLLLTYDYELETEADYDGNTDLDLDLADQDISNELEALEEKDNINHLEIGQNDIVNKEQNPEKNDDKIQEHNDLLFQYKKEYDDTLRKENDFFKNYKNSRGH